MTDIPDRLAAALADRYSLETKLGEGGMASVYLARDLRHNRKVAVKVLKPELAAVVGSERFLSEIETTANLQHPHILPLFDSGAADGFLYYVMPYVEGESLRDRIDRERQLPVDEALSLIRKIAAALQYAHEQGVVHRDIKPANILLSRGEPLVADFGIALALSEAGGGRITETGLSLGTPFYMSPEQATGERALDPRSDAYALACVLFEMLAGQPPYHGPTAQSVLARILTEEPARVTTLRRTVPEHVAAAIARGLEKLPADRFPSVQDFAAALGNPGFTHMTRAQPAASAAAPVRGSAGSSRPARTAALVGVVLIAGLVAGAGVATFLRPAPSPAQRTAVRLGFPDSMRVRTRENPTFAIAPDGSAIVYAGPGPASDVLWYQPLDRLEPRILPGTEQAEHPVFSPDGSSVAFTVGTPGDLKVVRLDGGAPVTLVRDSVQPYGLSWADDDWIYVTDNSRTLRIRAQGGPLEPVLTPDGSAGETWRGWPVALPGGEYVAFATWKGDVGSAEIGLLNTETGEAKILGQGTFPRYAATGHLIFTRGDGAVIASALDTESMSLTGTPAVLFEGISFDATQGFARMDIGRDGSLIYQRGANARERLVTVDLQGQMTDVDTAFAGDFNGIALSPDGEQVVTSVANSEGQNVYVRALSGGPWRRITFYDAGSVRPDWNPTAGEVMYIQVGGQNQGVYATRVDGTGEPREILRDSTVVQEIAYSPDGEWLAYRIGPSGQSQRDIWLVPNDGSGDDNRQPVAATNFDEHSPSFSPDGRWIMYVSSETGRSEVFVRPFPDIGSGKWQISESGGTEPVWGPNSDRIYYRSPASEMVRAMIVTQPSFSVTNRTTLFSAVNWDRDIVHATYDVLPDDRGFVAAAGDVRSGEIILVRNWFDELRARMGEQR